MKEKSNNIEKFLWVLFFMSSFSFQRFQTPFLILIIIVMLFANRVNSDELRARLKLNNPSIWFVFLLGLYILGVFTAQNSAEAWVRVGMKLSFLAFPFYFLLVRSFDKWFIQKSFVLVAAAFSLLAIFMAGYNFVTTGINPLISETGFNLFLHRSYQGVYWSLALIILVFNGKKIFEKQVLNIGAGMILALTTVLTFSKVGFLIVAIVFLGIVINLFRRRAFKQIALVMFFLVVGAIGINTITHKPLARMQAMISSILGNNDNNLDSNQERKLVWNASWESFLEKPLTGFGTGECNSAIEKKMLEKGNVDVAALKLNSHNQFLNTSVELGIFGALALIMCFVSSFLIISRGSNTRTSDTLLISAIMIFFFTESGFETQAGVVLLTFVILLAADFNSKLLASR